MADITEKTRRDYSGLDADKASIPAGVTEIKDTYLATDTKILYFWDGVAWTIIPLDVIVAGMIKTDAVETAKIKDLNVTVGKLAGGITAGKLAADCVETAKIKNLNVTVGKLAGGITANKLAADCVETLKIKDGNVTKAKAYFGLSLTDYRRTGQYHAGFIPGGVIAWGCNPNQLHAFAFYVPNAFTADRIAIYVSILGAGLNRLGIYKDDGNIYPGDLVLDAGTVDVSATGLKEIVINEALTPGLYWLVGLGNISHTVRAQPHEYSFAPCGSVDITTASFGSWYKAHAYGVLPHPFPSGASGGQIKMFVYLRKA